MLEMGRVPSMLEWGRGTAGSAIGPVLADPGLLPADQVAEFLADGHERLAFHFPFQYRRQGVPSASQVTQSGGKLAGIFGLACYAPKRRDG